MTISVAMATYNGAPYIREQLDSLARQTALPFELVITDDGSSDATLSMVEEFAATSPFPVRVYRNEARLRYAENFLKAAALCQGSWIACCDQDDIWLPNKLERMALCLADPEVLLAMHSADTLLAFGERGKRFPHFRQDRVYRQGQCNPFWNRPGFCMVVRSELVHWADHSLRPAKLHSHDHWLLYLAAAAGKIATTRDVLALYRQHGANVFGAPKKRSWREELDAGANTCDYAAVAEEEYECALALERVVETCPSKWAPAISRSIPLLRRRARLHALRGAIYKPKARLSCRIGTFLTILLTGGYGPDRTRTRLGRRSALKDLLIGVPALYRTGDHSKRPI